MCVGSNFEMKNCKINGCRNADLVKTGSRFVCDLISSLISHCCCSHRLYFQSKYTPFITIPSPEENVQTDDYYYDEGESSNIEYLDSRPAEYVPPPSYSLENQRPRKVTVRVENYIPLSDDTAQVMNYVLCVNV